MRKLELRLEDWTYGFSGGEKPLSYMRLAGEPLSDADAARLTVALEFFDRALIGALAAIDIRGINSDAACAFSRAAELTLLRFGVRIVGLEEKPEEMWKCPGCYQDFTTSAYEEHRGRCRPGKALGERCFFCGRKAKEPRTGFLPEHRNGPNDDDKTNRSFVRGGKRGGAATAAKKARLRGESWADL